MMIRLVAAFAFFMSSSGFSNHPKADCMDSLFSLLGVDTASHTDPELFGDVYQNDFHLQGLLIPRFKDYFIKPMPLQTLVQRVQHGVKNRHPAVYQLACAAQQMRSLPEITTETKGMIYRMLHSMVVLEGLVQEMHSSVAFMKELQSYYKKKRLQLIHNNPNAWKFYQTSGGIFGIAKLLTMDRVFKQYIHFRSKDKLNKLDLWRKNMGLKINITEATIADKVAKHQDNAYVGRRLLANPMDKIELDPNKIVLQHFTPGWAPLYEIWNLAFVIGKLDNLHLVLPKLLIPSVVDTDEERYLFNRGISLWVTINTVLFHSLEAKKIRRLPIAFQLDLVLTGGALAKQFAQDVGKPPRRWFPCFRR